MSEDDIPIPTHTETQEKKPPLELKVLEHSVDSGAIPVTWCVSKEYIKEIGEDALVDRRVVLVSAPLRPGVLCKDNAEWRTVADVKDMMAYVTFLRSGSNRIFAFLTSRYNDLDRVFQSSRSGEGKWEHNILSYYNQKENDDLCPCDGSFLIQAQIATLDIDLPKECFAKPPPEWLSNIANWFWQYKPIDQCAFRRRVLLSVFPFPIAPILALLSMVLRFIVAFGCTLVACRGVNWTPVIHPTTWSIFSIFDDIKGSYLIFPKLPLTMRYGFVGVGPILFLTGIAYLFGLDLWIGVHIYMLFLLGLLTLVVCTIGFTVLVVSIVWIMTKLWSIGFLQSISKALDRKLVEWRKQREAEDEAWAKQRALEEAELLECYAQNFRKMRDLPKRKRTLKLRFKGTKARVCRPFPV
jgi:hypothetical protein